METSCDLRDSVSASGKSGNACTNKVNSRDVRATILGQFVISSFFFTVAVMYYNTLFCWCCLVSGK